MTNGKRKKAAPIILTDDEKYQVYKACAEMRAIIVTAGHVQWRMIKGIVLQEINAKDLFGGRKLNDYHLNASIAEVVGWQDRLGVAINFQETAEVEQIKEQHTRDNHRIAELEEENRQLKKDLTAAQKAFPVADIRRRFSEIRALATINI